LGQTSNKPPIVFIVDDDEAIRDSMAAIVQSLGFDTQGFSSAEDFLSRGDTSRRGCLLLDVRMPGMSGLELHAQLVADGVVLPVIFISGHDDIANRNTETQSGVVAYLEKPCRPDVLASTIGKSIALSMGESGS
jgi:two-component system response regulator FixJ